MTGLTDEDLDIRRRAREFVDDLVPYEVETELAGGVLPAGLVREAAPRGTRQRAVRHQHADVRGRAGLHARCSRCWCRSRSGGSPTALAWCLHTPPQWWAEVATEEQLERWLRPAVRGERHECYAITEEHAGSDVSDLATTARRRRATTYVVNGIKWHVTSYNLADYCFVQAVLTDGPHEGEHVLLVVDLPTPGIEVVRTPAYSHNIADHHPIVSFTDVRIPATQLIGREGEGMTFTQDWFRFERVMVAARCVGASSRLVDEMTTFAGERMVGGQRLGDYQLVTAMLADSAAELYAARAALYETARAIDAGEDRKVLHARASMVKLLCSETAGRIADRAVQVFGGRGYMRENVAERMFRELRVERIWEGASRSSGSSSGSSCSSAGPAAVLGDD